MRAPISASLGGSSSNDAVPNDGFRIDRGDGGVAGVAARITMSFMVRQFAAAAHKTTAPRFEPGRRKISMRGRC